MKQNLDERQNQVAGKIGSISFVVMYLLCVMTIIIQLVFVNGTLLTVLGETIILLAGGGTYLVGAIKNGFFDSVMPMENSRRRTQMNCIESISISLVFSILYGIFIWKRASGSIDIEKYVVAFFVGIAILCFLVLTIMDLISKASRKKEEKKYDEESN